MPPKYIIAMAYSNSSNTTTSKLSPDQIYGDAGLIYIRYHAKIETKPNGDKKIGGSRPPFKGQQVQKKYGADSGDYYSLLMGHEFKPGRWSILLDFDRKSDDASQSGLELVKKLNMDQYDAPKQKTPSGGLHYIFYVDAQQKKHINSRTNDNVSGRHLQHGRQVQERSVQLRPEQDRGLRQVRLDQRGGREVQEHPEAPRRAL